MGELPAINQANIRLVALWILLVILIVMGWHFAIRQL